MQAEGSKTVAYGQGLDCPQLWDGFETFLQPVIRDQWSYMVNMVITDTTGKPLPYLREFIKGTPFYGGFYPVPFPVPRPVHPFEIMLDVKKPEAQHPSDEQDGELDQNISPETDREASEHQEHKDPEIGEENAVSFLFAFGPDGNPLVNEKNKDGPQDEHNKGIPGHPIDPSFLF
jgi:hypothetical protein